LSVALPPTALTYGFEDGPGGVHDSRTIMVTDLRRLLATCPHVASLEQYRKAVVEDNALLKGTVTSRQGSFRRLRELYAFRRDILLFRALRDLWGEDSSAQPLLAMLCAVGRDPVLRAMAPGLLDIPEGEVVTPGKISAIVEQTSPGRYNGTTLGTIGRHIASSWQQSGHLKGRAKKIRSRADARPASTAYALLLAYLCGARGEGLFDTLWCRLLDAPEHELRQHAIAASGLGWLEYRHAGNVTDISFTYLERPAIGKGEVGQE